VPHNVLNHLLLSESKGVRNLPTITFSEPSNSRKRQTLKPVQKENLPNSAAFNTNKASVANRVLNIVADEVGLDIRNLLLTSSFSDFGVDSLLSLNITRRFREELDLKVESSLFADCPAIKNLLDFLPTGATAPNFTDASTAPSTPRTGLALGCNIHNR
jgi:naphtho-gamma-pyrone polyketide synthase